MKRFFPAIVVCFAMQWFYAADALAQSKEDESAIQKVVSTFFENESKNDLTGALSQISRNFSAEVDGQALDYDKHVIFLKKSFAQRKTKVINLTYENLKTTEISFSDNTKAEAIVEYNKKGVDIKKVKPLSMYQKRRVSLAKENGVWKIVSIALFSKKE